MTGPEDVVFESWRSAVMTSIRDSDGLVAARSLLELALEDPDRARVESVLLGCLDEDLDQRLRVLAVVCMGHVGRIHGAVSEEVVLTLRELLDDPEYGPSAENALNDIGFWGPETSAAPRREMLISKYDEAGRAGTVDGWTSYDDIGKSFNGVTLLAEDYYLAEQAYLTFIRDVARALDVAEFVISAPMLSQRLPDWIGPLYSGRCIDVDFALLLVARMLRNGDFWCVLSVSSIVEISVEADFYLSVSVAERQASVLDAATSNGLFCVEVRDRDKESDPWIARVLDDQFWSQVEDRARGSPLVVLHRWANGSAGES